MLIIGPPCTRNSDGRGKEHAYTRHCYLHRVPNTNSLRQRDKLLQDTFATSAPIQSNTQNSLNILLVHALIFMHDSIADMQIAF